MCDCIEKFDEKLKEKGERLSLVILLTGGTRPSIQTETITGKGRPKINIIAKYCPFCGVEY